LFLAAAIMAAEAAPVLQTAAGPAFGDGSFQPEDFVTIHGVSNLEEGEPGPQPLPSGLSAPLG
jgi:hypothetical protein